MQSSDACPFKDRGRGLRCTLRHTDASADSAGALDQPTSHLSGRSTSRQTGYQPYLIPAGAVTHRLTSPTADKFTRKSTNSPADSPACQPFRQSANRFARGPVHYPPVRSTLRLGTRHHPDHL